MSFHVNTCKLAIQKEHKSAEIHEKDKAKQK